MLLTIYQQYAGQSSVDNSALKLIYHGHVNSHITSTRHAHKCSRELESKWYELIQFDQYLRVITLQWAWEPIKYE